MYLSLQQMREQFSVNPNVRFNEEVVGGRSLTIVFYMLPDDALWNVELGVETRGAVFDTETGELVILPFEKFFNVNEKAHTQRSDVAKVVNDEGAIFCEKLDGSMINAVVINDRVYLKTKKSFYSDVAKLAQNSMSREVENLIRAFVARDWSPIFEFTSPDSKIVIDYGNEPQFRLTAARNMTSGQYMSQIWLDHYAAQFGVGRNVWFPGADLSKYMDANEEGIEGWVIYTGKDRYKIKTRWYLDRHRLIDVRERDIARYVLEETLDDMIPSLIEGDADMSVVREIESNIAHDLSQLYAIIIAAGKIASYIPQGAERAAFVRKNYPEIQKFVFRAALGQEPKDEDLKAWYMQKNLSKFSLRSIGNPNFRTVEEES